MRAKKSLKSLAKKIPPVDKYLQQKVDLQVQVDQLTAHTQNLTLAQQRYERANQQLSDQVRQLSGETQKHTISWPVRKDDLLAVQLQNGKLPRQKSKKSKLAKTIGWVIPPMGDISGGHTDIFRAIQYLEKQGYKNTIYFYDASESYSLDELKITMARNYPAVEAEVFYNPDEYNECDGLFATNWFTAYPVARSSKAAQKFYFVQDFEPFFDPVGTYYTLAENTYKFGLHGVTLGKWLQKKLSSEYGMKCDYIDLGVDSIEYNMTNSQKRKKVMFYARPHTPRRGFELGLLALEVFHDAHPDYEINFIGWDTSTYDIPFPYVNHGVLNNEELNQLYNDCAAGLVISLTNMSLLPIELLNAGTAVVVNDAAHTREIPYASLLDYAQSTPQALADTLYQAASTADPVKIAKQATTLSDKLEWNVPLKKLEKIISKQLT